MKFTKSHGLGNDFVLVNGLQETLPADLGPLAMAMCHRHFGIGADGLMVALPSERADIRMRIINSDGSEAEMCGNGIRCFAKYVYEEGIVAKKVMTVETLAGIMVPELYTDEQGLVTRVKVDMGQPILERGEIPMTGAAGQAVAETITVDGQPFAVTAVSMGNPHCVIFTDDLSQEVLETWGPRLEKCAYFPKKTNVEFVRVENDREVTMRVWERGAAVTMACGTGACATAVAAVLNGKTGRRVLVHLDGGDLEIYWDEAGDHVFMTGPAEKVFDGWGNWS